MISGFVSLVHVFGPAAVHLQKKITYSTVHAPFHPVGVANAGSYWFPVLLDM